ncbi:hypothetical protein SAMN05216421_1253 [Halopseudomonas xinjiangensis]|uniref:Copper(I)-binding protein n=1 Tax=Halopseudomonas xinjiangensis TaxID=487184 RepID=A0A1H1R078_9GAMM|nr:copper chaperone PCu(A)C [Halopseudomonas xinjiangensis]SDS29147.1 hypothetical protein SAMN05216421_1253 [Halopseudomonas xinjiangensis]
MTRLTLVLALLLSSTGSVMAGQSQLDDLHISRAWSRALPPVAPTGAAYMSIENRGGQAARLVGVSTPIAERAEVHQHTHTEGVMRMQRVDDVVIEPGQQVDFAPGGYHIMLFNLNEPLAAGASYPLTLRFEQAGDVEVQIDVQDDAPQAGHHH